METQISSKKVFWNIWTSYAVYYFGKVNLSIIVPALLVSYKNLSLYNVGLISSGFFFAYAVGQFLHGQIAERCNPFKYIAFGLIASGIMNCIMGAAGGFFLVLLIGETLDGFFQSMGWSSCVRANTLFQKDRDREKSATLLGTSYQIGNSVAWLISAWVVGRWDWRAGFFVASAFLIVRGLLLLAIRPKMDKIVPVCAKKQIRTTLTFPIVASGMSLCLLNMVRYGVITWIPLYLFQKGNYTVAQMGKVGLKVCLIPVFGVLGTLAFNVVKIEKDVLAVLSLIALGISFIIFPMMTGLGALSILFVGSFFLYGTHVFLVSTFPTRFVDKRVVSASTGFIDGMGYVGTCLIGVLVPFLINLADGHWCYVFALWVSISFLTAALVLTVYKKLTKRIS